MGCGMKKPFELAKEWCDEHDECLYSEIELHLACGWVYSGDDAFVLATEEDSHSLTELSLNKEVDIDTWYVYLYAGDLKRVLGLIPYNRKYVAFRRNNGNIKLYDMEKLLRKI